eukprot:m.731625 g.731625  ORF g.731625 m.731625 type:complete len:193 (+) comp23060_c0_seq17:527-1105(+)
MLRPSSGKWRETWCILRGNQLQFSGTEKERVRCVVGGSSARTTKKFGKHVFAGTIVLNRGVKLCHAAAGSTVDDSALFPSMHARSPVPPHCFKLTDGSGHSYYFAGPSEHICSWYAAIESTLQHGDSKGASNVAMMTTSMTTATTGSEAHAGDGRQVCVVIVLLLCSEHVEHAHSGAIAHTNLTSTFSLPCK